MTMMLRRLASALGTIAVVLAAHSGPAAAHGIDITAEIDGTVATLELTDETGEVCAAIDPAPENSAVVAIVDDATNEVLVILGEGFSTTPSCQFFDVDVVNGVLENVDAHRLVIAFGNSEASGVLAKPALPQSETAIQPDDGEDDGPNVPLIFGVGASLGIALVILRKRFLP